MNAQHDPGSAFNDSRTDTKAEALGANPANHYSFASLANISHEIRTPLIAILGFSELLENQETSSEERIRYANVVRRNSEKLGSVINDLLDLSKLEAGSLEFESIPANPLEIMDELSAHFQQKCRAAGIAFRLTSTGPLPKTIRTDPRRLKQILLNVIGYALKHTSQGSLEVTVVPTSTDSGPVSFLIKSMGTELRPDEVAEMFVPFVKKQKALQNEYQYNLSSLALSLSKRLAQRLGGDVILAENKAGRGFLLVASAASLKLDTAAPSSKKAHNKQTKAEPHRILLTEDNHDLRMYLTKMLEEDGFLVTTAVDGVDALEKVDQSEFDLILMDLQMPRMDGFEATAQLRRRGYDRPVVALTAFCLTHDRNRCLASGFDEYIAKPVDFATLRNTLVELIEQSPSSSWPGQMGAS